MDFRSILDFFNNLTAEDWQLIGKFALYAVSLPVVVQIVRGLFALTRKFKLESDNARYIVSVIVTAGVSLLEYAQGDERFGKWFAVAQASINTVTSQTAYRLALKHVFRAIGAKFMQIWQQELAKAYQSQQPAVENAVVEPGTDFI